MVGSNQSYTKAVPFSARSTSFQRPFNQHSIPVHIPFFFERAPVARVERGNFFFYAYCMNGRTTAWSGIATTRRWCHVCGQGRANTQLGCTYCATLFTLNPAPASISFHLWPEYISTHANHLADDLSCNHISSFFFKVPQASQPPSPVPAALMDLLLDQGADWTSLQWCLAQSTQKSYGAQGFIQRGGVPWDIPPQGPVSPPPPPQEFHITMS